MKLKLLFIIKTIISSPAIGHYTQMAWADIEYVGCGRSVWWSNDGWMHLYLACDYGGKKTGGNLLGASIYITGEACSKCPNNTTCNKDWPGLCGVTERVNKGNY